MQVKQPNSGKNAGQGQLTHCMRVSRSMRTRNVQAIIGEATMFPLGPSNAFAGSQHPVQHQLPVPAQPSGGFSIGQADFLGLLRPSALSLGLPAVPVGVVRSSMGVPQHIFPPPLGGLQVLLAFMQWLEYQKRVCEQYVQTCPSIQEYSKGAICHKRLSL